VEISQFHIYLNGRSQQLALHQFGLAVLSSWLFFLCDELLAGFNDSK
jgi:hypothetical protein